MDDFNGDIRQVDCTQTVFVGDAGGRLRVSTQTNKPPPKKKTGRLRLVCIWNVCSRELDAAPVCQCSWRCVVPRLGCVVDWQLLRSLFKPETALLCNPLSFKPETALLCTPFKPEAALAICCLFFVLTRADVDDVITAQGDTTNPWQNGTQACTTAQRTVHTASTELRCHLE